MSYRENSTAAALREDIFAAAVESIEEYLQNTRHGILKSAGYEFVDGQARLNFPGPGMEGESSTTLNAQRAPMSTFQRADYGEYYTLNMDPTDFGRAYIMDFTNNDVIRMMRAGMSEDDIIEKYMMRSFKAFVEQIEIKGTSASGGIGNATTPFDGTLCADYDVNSSSDRWDEDDSNPVNDVQVVKDSLWNDCRVYANTAYMSTSHRRTLATHPALTANFGGNVGFGGLTEGQIAQALGLEKVYVLDPDYIGDYVTICAQGAPRVMRSDNSHSCIYGYNPEKSGDLYGLQMSAEKINGGHGQMLSCLTFAFCDLGWNPLGGRRLADCLA
jgi:hypothetical protein